MDAEETRSTTSQKSNRSAARSSVLQRARAYNRQIDERAKQRSKSLEKRASSSAVQSPRSQSAGRNRVSTRERALQSVRNEESPVPQRTAPAPQQPRVISPRPVKIMSSPKQSKKEMSPPKNEDAVVTPELLVDALSGHEDGLLAIAERLMEHYDSGYDVMGEAIIDAFADVQKLFQHVVEAAHMEGAAFEASRREEEDKQKPDAAVVQGIASPGGPSRHDEFIDQDVKDVLTQAIREGAPLRDASKHEECFEVYEKACNSASSLLPVDSDHRGRLQLSIARAESMTPDRACAILRYAMDDVLRSGLRPGATLPDPSKRGDCVLTKPKDHPSVNGGNAQAVQSSKEELASLVEELKEVLSAPIYNDTPLQSVAERFWAALTEAQRAQAKKEEQLEHALGELKGEYLMARAEWEEKLTTSRDQTDIFKKKYMKLKETQKGTEYMDQARSTISGVALDSSQDDDSHYPMTIDSMRSRKSSGPGSVASLGSGLAHQARTLASSFSCATNSDRGVLDTSSPYRRSKSAPRSPGRNSEFSDGKSRRGRSRQSRHQEMEV